ncbi:MAG: hypothetical protein JXQ89_14535, partial [Pelagimonas sp.]
MPSQTDTPPWTLSGWLWGIMGLCAAMLYLMGWYFLFAAPLVLIFVMLAALVSPFTESFEASLGVVSLVVPSRMI